MADKNGTFEGDKIKPDVYVNVVTGSVSSSDSKAQASNIHVAPSGLVVGEIKTTLAY